MNVHRPLHYRGWRTRIHHVQHAMNHLIATGGKDGGSQELFWTPNSAARRVMCAAYAEATSVLVGMQPVLTYVPPKRPRSIMATRWPAAPTALPGMALIAHSRLRSHQTLFSCSQPFRSALLKIDLDVASRP